MSGRKHFLSKGPTQLIGFTGKEHNPSEEIQGKDFDASNCCVYICKKLSLWVWGGLSQPLSDQRSARSLFGFTGPCQMELPLRNMVIYAFKCLPVQLNTCLQKVHCLASPDTNTQVWMRSSDHFQLESPLTVREHMGCIAGSHDNILCLWSPRGKHHTKHSHGLSPLLCWNTLWNRFYCLC